MAGLHAVGLAARTDTLRPELARWDAFAARLHRCFVLDEALRALPAPDTLVCRSQSISTGDEAAVVAGANRLMDYLERFARQVIDS